MTWVCDDVLILAKCAICIHNSENTPVYDEDRYPYYTYGDDGFLKDCNDYEELNR